MWSKGKPTAPGNHILPITDTEVRVTQLMGREDGSKERTGVLKRFESKVTLQRTRKVSDALPGEDLEREDNLSPQDGKDQHRFRLPQFMSFVGPAPPPLWSYKKLPPLPPQVIYSLYA